MQKWQKWLRLTTIPASIDSAELHQWRFKLYVTTKCIESAIAIYIQGLSKGVQFPRTFHVDVRKVVKKTRNPYLILKFYNDLFFAKITENSDDVASAKIDNALKRIPAYKVGIAYCELTRKVKVHKLIFREVIDKLASEHSLVQHTLQCYNDMISKGYYLDVWTYNRLIDSVCKSDDLGTAWKIIEDMIHVGVHPDIVTFNILLNRQISRKDWNQAVRILDMIQEAGLHPSESTLNTLTRNKLLEKLNPKEVHEYSTTVLKRMSLFNRLEWFSTLGNTTKLIQIYQEMITNGLSQDIHTFEVIIRNLFTGQNSDKVKQLYDEMRKLGSEPTSFLYNILIEGFVKLEDMDSAQCLYRDMSLRSIIGDVNTYNLLIWGHSQKINLKEIIFLLDDMLLFKIRPNIYTISILLNLYIRLNDIRRARQLFDMLLETEDQKPNLYIFNSLISGYANVVKDMVEAKRLLLYHPITQTLHPKALTFNIVIQAYTMQNEMDAAMDLMRQMENIHGVEPNAWTFYHLITGYLNNGHFNQAFALLKYMSRRGIKPDWRLKKALKEIKYRIMYKNFVNLIPQINL
ncbi:3830_t:CDS:1 [Cetraspora pellucida]|uniref:3830_t:CDS:1 n=1 Tax=Cetraspora pellucida TaxID=1433469 RepID=A0A9N9BCC1_9GLOM|nr:3830_t:CDS:1 [Cetraspora pellucida]